MAYSTTFLTTTFQISSGLPATYNFAGYNVLTYIPIFGAMMWEKTGMLVESIETDLLAGNRVYELGILLGPKIAFQFKTDLIDPGQVLMKALNNQAPNCSIKTVENDGSKEFYSGVLTNIQSATRDTKNTKSFTGEFRVNSVTVYA